MTTLNYLLEQSSGLFYYALNAKGIEKYKRKNTFGMCFVILKMETKQLKITSRLISLQYEMDI